MSEAELQKIPADAPPWRVAVYELRQYGIAAIVAAVLAWFSWQLYQDQKLERQTKDARIERMTDRLASSYEANAVSNARIAGAVEQLTDELRKRTSHAVE